MRRVIYIKLPGTLKYRDLAVRAVSSACKLVAPLSSMLHREFADHVVSAFAEAYNNAALHSYRGRAPGNIEIEIDDGQWQGTQAMIIRMRDFGNSFDLAQVPTPDLDSLPESGLGIFIIKSFMDDVSYQAGAPNILSMTKRIPTADKLTGEDRQGRP